MRFIICDTERLKNCLTHISSLPLDGEFAVEIVRRKRTIPQNNLWHKWIDIIADYCGTSAENMKDVIKEMVLGREEFINPITGEIKGRLKSSAELDKEDFSKLMLQTQVIAADCGIILPSPEDLR